MIRFRPAVTPSIAELGKQEPPTSDLIDEAAEGTPDVVTRTAKPPVRPLMRAVPDVRAFVASPPPNAVDRNRIITTGYQQFASLIQDMVDPTFAKSGISSLPPNWFALGSFASRAGGQNLVALEDVLNTLSRSDSLVSLYEGARELQARLPKTYAGDARVYPTLLARFVALCRSSHEGDSKERVEQVATTAYNALAQGNLQIYADIGGAAQDFFVLRQRHGPFRDDASLFDALAEVWAEGDAAEFKAAARDALTYGRIVGADIQALKAAPAILSHISVRHGRAFVAAAFALYEEAGRTSDLTKKAAIVAAANMLIALREQRDAAQPSFEGIEPTGIDRGEVFRLFTPFVSLGLGTETWSFSRWAEGSTVRSRLFGGDNNPFDAPSTDYNWATFDDRWPAIMDFFAHAYTRPTSVWRSPVNPNPRV